MQSAKAISNIITQDPLITTLDLNLNNLAEGVTDLFHGIKQNKSLVCLRLRNNNLDGRKLQKELYEMLCNHKSLTAIDFGNSDHVCNRNRIYDDGLKAIIEAIAESESSLISELHLQSCLITGRGLSVMQSLKCDLQILDLANNDIGSDISCLRPVLRSIRVLNLSNVKLQTKGCIELGYGL